MQINILLSTHNLFDVSTKADRILLGKYKREIIDEIKRQFECSLTVNITHDNIDHVDIFDTETEDNEHIRETIEQNIIEDIKEKYL